MMDEKLTKEALMTLGFEVREVSKRELELSYLALKDSYTNSGNKELLEKVNNAYQYLTKDIRVTNEVIRNILEPNNKTYFYQENKEEKIEKEEKVVEGEVIDNKPTYNPNLGDIKVIDKPSLAIFLLSLFMPVYGILNFAALKRIMPKASKFYLVAGILGFVLEILLLVAMFLA